MANYMDQLNLNGNVGEVLGCDFDNTYPGVDLTQKFSSEIAGYSDVGQWIKARIHAGNFSKIHNMDYIPITCTNGTKLNARIAGINTYKGYGDKTVGNHIDFITATLWPTSFKMNLKNFNNGLSPNETLTGDGSSTEFTLTKPFPSISEIKIAGKATTEYTYDPETHKITFNSAPASGAAIAVSSEARACPWLVSNGYHFLNSLKGMVPNGTGNNPDMAEVDYTEEGVYHFLPDWLKNVIVEKRLYIPQRYSDTAIQVEDTAGSWQNIGKLWLPTEYEVMGCGVGDQSRFSMIGCVQYPIFAHSMNRNFGRLACWSMSTFGGISTTFVLFGYTGLCNYYLASTDYRGPVCFRISA